MSGSLAASALSPRSGHRSWSARSRAALGWVVLAALAVALAWAVDWRRALAVAAGTHQLWLLVAVALNGSILALATLQWRLLLPVGARVRARALFEIVALTTSVSNGGPMLAGHATGIHLLATRGSLGPAGGVSVTILDQLAEGMAKLALLAAALLVVPRFGLPAAGATLALAMPALALGLWWLARRAEQPSTTPTADTGRGAVARFLADTIARLDALRTPRRFAAAVALAVLQKAAEGLAIAAVAAALGVALPAWAALAALAAVNFSQFVAVTPANVGGYEGAAFLVFRAAGVDPGAALALAVVQHVAYLLPLAGTGWVIEGARLLRGRPAAASEEVPGA